MGESPSENTEVPHCPSELYGGASCFMAKRGKISAKGFYLPYDAPQKVFQDRRMREFDTLRTIILTCGPSFVRVPKGLRRYHLDALVAIGWLKYAHNRWWQVSLSKIFPFVEGTQKHWHSLDLLQKDARAVLHKFDLDYQTRIHTISQAPKNQRSESCGGDEKTRQLNRESKHLGGMSLSTQMERLGISKGYAYKLRKLLTDQGLAVFHQRFRSTKWDTAAEGRAGGTREYLFDGYCGAWTQLTSLYVPLVPAQMRMHIGKIKKDGWRLREKRDQRLVSNFVTGGAYAM